MSIESDEERLRWKSHCRRMAEATYALAEWCEDPDMISLYLDLAARWLRLAETPPKRLGYDA